MAYTKYSLTPANNTAAPPDGAPEGMLPSAVNDTMRDMMAQIRDVGDGIRGGTYTMTAPVITGGSINGTTIGATTASTGKFSTLTNAALTSGRVTYAGTSGVLQDDADFTFNGTTVTMANDASISGLTVGKGGGAVATNTAVGSNSPLGSNTTGASSVAVGSYALNQNLTGIDNTAVGFGAGFYITGSANTAIGRSALSTASASTGSNNTAVGFYALQANTTASSNTAVGYQAAYANTTGQGITAIGKSVLVANTTGNSNVGVGGTRDGALSGALISNTTGSENVAIGVGALSSNTTGSNNVGVGHLAGTSITTGSKNTIVGSYSGNQSGLNITTSNNHIVLSDGDGNPRAYWNDTGQAIFTATSGTGLSVTNNFTGNGTPLILTQSATNAFNAMEIRNSGATGVFIVAANGNATNTNNSYGGISDIKLKENIVDATPKLDDLMQVKVRNYNLIGDNKKQIGVVAQELEQVFAGLVDETPDRDKEGNDLGTTTKSVKYSVFVPMLIKAVQELKAEVDSLKQQLGN